MSPRSASLDIPQASQTRPHTLFLAKPTLGGASASSISLNSLQPSQPTTPFRPHISLSGLLPKHAIFRARITIHQVHSVPFVSGEFAVRWKLKGVHNPAGTGLLERVVRSSDKGKAKEEVSMPGTPTETERGWRPRRKPTGPALLSSVTSKPRPHHLNANSSSSMAATTSTSATGSTSTMVTTSEFTSATATSTSNSSFLLAPPRTLHKSSSSTLLVPAPSTLPPPLTAARGMTPFLPLKDHAVVWGQTLDTFLRIEIDRETAVLNACQAKLVVMQRIVAADGTRNSKTTKNAGKPQSPRLGAVYLNLAEYVGQGQVERRYLLRESKVNATLRVTVEMEYVSGSTTYTPPPLAPGEILTGIAGYLDQDIVKRRPKVQDIYGPYRDQKELEIDLLGAVIRSDVDEESIPDRLEAPSPSPTISTWSSHNPGNAKAAEHTRRRDLGAAFDMHRLPFAYGTKTTETLIEALFNPTRTTERRNESPFTYYEPPDTDVEPSATKPLAIALVEPQTASTTAALETARPSGLRQSSMSTTDMTTLADMTSASGTNSTTTTTTTSTTTSSCAASIRTTESSAARGRSGWDWDKARDRTPMPDSRNVNDDSAPVQVPEPSAAGGMRSWWKRKIHGAAVVGTKA